MKKDKENWLSVEECSAWMQIISSFSNNLYQPFANKYLPQIIELVKDNI